MRIIYHHRTRATDAQGVHIAEIIRGLEALGHTVEVVAMARPNEDAVPASRDAKRQRRSLPLLNEFLQLAYNAVGFPRLLAAAWRKRPGMIYERYSAFNVSGVLAGKLLSIPVALEVNSPLALEQHREGAIRLYGLARWLEKVICNNATRVLVVSTPLRRILERNGVDAAKLTVLPNGVNPDKFGRIEGTEELRASLGLSGSAVVGFSGWFRAWHGLENLIEAFANAGLARRGARLLLVGDGPATPSLQALVKKLGLQDAVIFTGPVPHKEMPRYVSLFDIAVQPAANEYCCPMKILEYMALGRPIVAPAQDNIRDLLREDECAWFEPGSVAGLGSAISGLLSDDKRRRDLRARVRRAIESRQLLWTSNARRAVQLATASGAAGREAGEQVVSENCSQGAIR